MDALIQGSSNKKKRLQGGKLSRFYAQEALSFIEQNYTLPITVEDMANRCNLDRSYFGKVFKRYDRTVSTGLPDPLSNE